MFAALLLVPTAVTLPMQRTVSMNAPSVGVSRRSIISAASAAGLSLVALPVHAELYSTAASCTASAVCTGTGKTNLAAYDLMLLNRASDELDEMIKDAPAEKMAGYKECKRLVGLVLDLDWKSLEAAAKTLDPSQSATKKLFLGIQKKDPKTAAKSVLEIAEDLDVSTFSSAGTGYVSTYQPGAGNPFDPRKEKFALD